MCVNILVKIYSLWKQIHFFEGNPIDMIRNIFIWELFPLELYPFRKKKR